MEDTEESLHSISLQSMWLRIVSLRNLNGIRYPSVFRDALSGLTFVASFSSSAHPECATGFEDLGFEKQWQLLVSGYFILVAVSFITDLVKSPDEGVRSIRNLLNAGAASITRFRPGRYVMTSFVMAIFTPSLLQFSFAAVTCMTTEQGVSVVAVSSDVKCPISSRSTADNRAYGVFSVIFIVVVLISKLASSLRAGNISGTRLLTLFLVADIVRQCTPPLSTANAGSAVVVLFLANFLQITVYALSWSTNEQVKYFLWRYGLILSDDAKPLEKAVCVVLAATFILDCIFARVVAGPKYSDKDGESVGIFCIFVVCVALLSSLWASFQDWRSKNRKKTADYSLSSLWKKFLSGDCAQIPPPPAIAFAAGSSVSYQWTSQSSTGYKRVAAAPQFLLRLVSTRRVRVTLQQIPLFKCEFSCFTLGRTCFTEPLFGVAVVKANGLRVTDVAYKDYSVFTASPLVASLELDLEAGVAYTVVATTFYSSGRGAFRICVFDAVSNSPCALAEPMRLLGPMTLSMGFSLPVSKVQQSAMTVQMFESTVHGVFHVEKGAHSSGQATHFLLTAYRQGDVTLLITPDGDDADSRVIDLYIHKVKSFKPSDPNAGMSYSCPLERSIEPAADESASESDEDDSILVSRTLGKGRVTKVIAYSDISDVLVICVEVRGSGLRGLGYTLTISSDADFDIREAACMPAQPPSSTSEAAITGAPRLPPSDSSVSALESNPKPASSKLTMQASVMVLKTNTPRVVVANPLAINLGLRTTDPNQTPTATPPLFPPTTSLPRSSEKPSMPPSQGHTLDGGWVRHFDEDTGEVWYVDNVGQSHWTLPPGIIDPFVAAPTSSVQGAFLSGGWRRYFYDSGTVWYVGPDGKSSWGLPYGVFDPFKTVPSVGNLDAPIISKDVGGTRCLHVSGTRILLINLGWLLILSVALVLAVKHFTDFTYYLGVVLCFLVTLLYCTVVYLLCRRGCSEDACLEICSGPSSRWS